MLNSVSTESRDEPPRARVRLSSEERRRQLLGIGLQMLVEKPIQDLSVDAVAAEAGISRGLLFHYFPTKNDFHDAVVEAAMRRVLRNTRPDADVPPEEAVHQFVERFYAQVERRREFYLALVYGSGALALGGDRVESHRTQAARRVVEAAGLDEAALPVAHAWTAYVEDRALQWSGRPAAEREPLDGEVAHCVRALHALLNA